MSSVVQRESVVAVVDIDVGQTEIDLPVVCGLPGEFRSDGLFVPSIGIIDIKELIVDIAIAFVRFNGEARSKSVDEWCISDEPHGSCAVFRYACPKLQHSGVIRGVGADID